jgi:hypothetical protein
MQKRLILFPDFINIQSACDILNRVSWGLYGLGDEGIKVCLPEVSLSGIHLSDWLKNPILTESIENYLPELLPLLMLSDRREIGPGDAGLFWDSSTYSDNRIGVGLEQRILVDPTFRFNYEADQIAALQYTLLTESQRQAIRDTSSARFAEFIDRWKNIENAYLYLTGPSVETISQNPVDRSAMHIICNSLVKNEGLMRQLQPNVLMFSDPAFHFGISKYAATFRNYVKMAMINFPEMICMVPERYYPLTNSFLGPEACERIIGIPVKEIEDFHFPSVEEFHTRKTGNILTLMMIPVASSLTNRVHILGADGRASSDKGYWAHAKSSQISDQLRSIYESHPSLARDEDVEKYYQEHCSILDAQLAYGETKQHKVYMCETPSMIPALAKRMIRS